MQTQMFTQSMPKKNIGIAVSFPGAALGTVLEVKKGRASIAFTSDELDFLAQITSILAFNGVTGEPQTIDVTPESAETQTA